MELRLGATGVTLEVLTEQEDPVPINAETEKLRRYSHLEHNEQRARLAGPIST